MSLVRGRAPEPQGPEKPKVDDFPDDPRYDFQPETVGRLLKYGQMIAQVATGGGKSRIATLAVARIRRPTLFLTTRSVLMYQMRDHFEEAGFTAGVLGDGEWAPRKGVNVGMVQTLMARLENLTEDLAIERYLANQKMLEQRRVDELEESITRIFLERALPTRKKPKIGDLSRGQRTQLEKEIKDRAIKLTNQLVRERPTDEEMARTITERVERQAVIREKTIQLLSYFEFVIGEEAHEAGSNGYYEITRHCKNAFYRLALTATPFMRPDAEANMRLMACFGPIGIQISEKLLIDRGILATPYFKYVTTARPQHLFRSTGWQRAYRLGIVENAHMNGHIVFEAKRAARYGLTSMVLVQREKHGKALEAAMKAAGVQARFIFGKHEQTERKVALDSLKAGRIDVLIGTTILDVGVDVPAVGMIILAGGGKAEVGLRQRVGRGLRAKKSGPNVAFIVDFTGDHNRYLREHAKTRRAIVESTPGFAENILPAGKDFDFKGLGL